MFEKWKKKLIEKLNRAGKDDRGSAFVFVIIGIMFTSIVGATVLSIATSYVTSVIVENFSTDNSYQTEGYIGEIRSGLEEIAGKANEEAYMEVINDYNELATPAPGASGGESMKKRFGRVYLEKIVEGITGDPISTNPWDADPVEGADPDAEPTWHDFSINSIKEMVTDRNAVTSSYMPGMLRFYYDFDEETEEMSVVISGLKIEHKDPEAEDDYQTQILTDIRIGVPDYNLDGSNTLNQLKNYILISDGKLSINNVVGNPTSGSQTDSGTGVKFKGNVYTGKMASNGTSLEEQDISIDIEEQAKAIFESGILITRGDLVVEKHAQTKISGPNNSQNGNFWLKNIVLKSIPTATDTSMVNANTLTPLYDNLTLKGNSYVLDDLSIEDSGTSVNLQGKYYGLGYNKENDGTSTEGIDVADYSSAILINGKNTFLKSDLNKLVLSGRAFIERENKGSPDDKDFMMGESISVKSNQIAYLVPSKYISVGHNPASGQECQKAGGKDNLVLKDELLVDLGAYLDNTQPFSTYTDNATDVNYTLYYLNFQSVAKANEYFESYYRGVDSEDNSNKELINDRGSVYITPLNSNELMLSPSLYLIAGNIINNYSNTYTGNASNTFQSANYYDDAGNVNINAVLDSQKKMENYLGRQLTLLNSGYQSGWARRYENLPDDQKKQLVRDTILSDEIDNTSNTFPVTYPKTENLGPLEKPKIYIVDGDYTLDGTAIEEGIVVCGGNVHITSNFKGLILARGEVDAANPTLLEEADIKLVGELMTVIRENEYLAKFFADYVKDGENSVNVADCIHYENWEKNPD